MEFRITCGNDTFRQLSVQQEIFLEKPIHNATPH